MTRTSSVAHIASQFILTLLLTLVLIAFLLFLGAAQLTSESPAQRTLRRAVAVTTDLDARLPQLEADLHEAADASTAEPVPVPNFPIPVEISREDPAFAHTSDLRDRLLSESASKLYQEGPAVWANSDDSAADQNIERVSTAGGHYRGFSLLTNDWHAAFVVVAIISGGLAFVLAAVLLINLPAYLRLIALSGVTLTASVLSLAAAVGLRFALRTAETEADPFEEGLIDIGVDTLWLFIRNYLIVSILALAVLAISSLATWQRSRVSGPVAEEPVSPTP